MKRLVYGIENFKDLNEFENFIKSIDCKPWIFISERYYDDISTLKVSNVFKLETMYNIIVDYCGIDGSELVKEEMHEMIIDWYNSMKRSSSKNKTLSKEDKVIYGKNGKKATIHISEFIKLEGVYPNYTPYICLEITNFKSKYKIDLQKRFNNKLTKNGKFTAKLELDTSNANLFDRKEWNDYKESLISFIENTHIINE